jgi:putative transposase
LQRQRATSPIFTQGGRPSRAHRGCFDNAACESFFATLKTELVHPRAWPTRQAARTAIYEYIEVFYNRRRRHSALNYLSPAEYERRHHQQQPATLVAA